MTESSNSFCIKFRMEFLFEFRLLILNSAIVCVYIWRNKLINKERYIFLTLCRKWRILFYFSPFLHYLFHITLFFKVKLTACINNVLMFYFRWLMKFITQAGLLQHSHFHFSDGLCFIRYMRTKSTNLECSWWDTIK